MDTHYTIICKVQGARLAPSDHQKEDVAKYLMRFENREIQVSFGPPRRTRSNSQNRYLWGVVYNCITLETGHTPEEVHEAMKDLFCPKQFVMIGGQEVRVPKSTTDLSTIEMTQYLERIREFSGRTLGINIPLPGEIP